MAYVRHYFLKASARYHHVDFPIIKGIDIEVHFTPTWMSAYPDNRFLQKWFAEEQEAQFANTVTLPENTGTIPVPTPAFNRIFLLIHIYRHFFDEGIGLRQLLDYAMLLNQGTTEKEKAESVRILKRMHLLRFTSALMHILQNVFGIEGKHLLTAPSEKRGISFCKKSCKMATSGSTIVISIGKTGSPPPTSPANFSIRHDS